MVRFEKASGLRKSKVAKALSDAADVTTATVYNWRKGTGVPNLDQALRMAAVMGCDAMDFTE